MLDKNYNHITKTIYFDNKTIELLDATSKKLSISKSALVRLLINQYCKVIIK